MPHSAIPPACVLWFTGLSGSGKSTIAKALYADLVARGLAVEYLDGDTLRDLFPGTGFTKAERDAHVKRVGFLASRLEHHGVTAICALISPYRETRDAVRQLCRRFIEIHISTPLDECERRDVKGLYARARRGEIANFTGIDDPYEAPKAPEITIATQNVPVAEAVARIVDYVRAEPTHRKAIAESMS
jgi:adenylylsulfate kinase